MILGKAEKVFNTFGVLFTVWFGWTTASSDELRHKILGFTLVFVGVVWAAVVIWGIFLRKEQCIPTQIAKREERRTFFFSPGIAVSLNRSAEGATVFVNLHILSTEPTELIFIRIILTDSTGLRITCEHSEPLRVDKFELTAKTIEQKITQQELSKFQKGMLVNLDGYAKFRDGNNITQEQIRITTIPNV